MIQRPPHRFIYDCHAERNAFPRIILSRRLTARHWSYIGCPTLATFLFLSLGWDTSKPTRLQLRGGTMTVAAAPMIRAPRGNQLRCKAWPQEAALRCLMNNLDPEVAERPADLVVYGGIGRAARNWECFHAILH